MYCSFVDDVFTDIGDMGFVSLLPDKL